MHRLVSDDCLSNKALTSLSVFGKFEVKFCFDLVVLIGEFLALLAKDKEDRYDGQIAINRQQS